MGLFADVKGQKRAVNLLMSHLKNDNLSHSYLFIGKEGTGKEFIAKEFAGYILCDNAKGDDCDSCIKYEKGIHPDFFYIDGAGGIKINQIREVIERINLTPSLSKRKVLLITKAENIGIEAANALLKTLEEPPADSVIVITTKSEKRLPETIISRSQLIKLNVISEEDIKEALKSEFSKKDVDEVISIAEGSIGKAKKLLSDKKHLKEKKEIITDIEILFKSKSVIEKFNVLNKYDKKKNLKVFFDIYSRVIFNSIYSEILEKEVGLSSLVPESVSLPRKKVIGNKILKIYRNLDYNVSLRIAMEEIILEDELNA